MSAPINHVKELIDNNIACLVLIASFLTVARLLRVAYEVFAGSASAREQTIACNKDYGAHRNIKDNKQCAP